MDKREREGETNSLIQFLKWIFFIFSYAFEWFILWSRYFVLNNLMQNSFICAQKMMVYLNGSMTSVWTTINHQNIRWEHALDMLEGIILWRGDQGKMSIKVFTMPLESEITRLWSGFRVGRGRACSMTWSKEHMSMDMVWSSIGGNQLVAWPWMRTKRQGKEVIAWLQLNERQWWSKW